MLGLLLRFQQFSFRLPARGDVTKNNYGTDEFPSITPDRRAGVFHPKAGTVLAPKHFVVNMVDLPIHEGRVDRAISAIVGRPIRVMVMNEVMLGFSN